MDREHYRFHVIFQCGQGIVLHLFREDYCAYVEGLTYVETMFVIEGGYAVAADHSQHIELDSK